jgi:malic enzyme
VQPPGQIRKSLAAQPWCRSVYQYSRHQDRRATFGVGPTARTWLTRRHCPGIGRAAMLAVLPGQPGAAACPRSGVKAREPEAVMSPETVMSTETRAVAGPSALRGVALLGRAGLNRDAAFTDEQRAALGLRGLLPCGIATIEEQVALELEHLHRKTDPLEQYIGLAALQDRNETLFYRVLVEHLEELAPIVYTPTVGDACRQFSHVLRRPRGLWITPDDIERIPELLDNVGRPDLRLIVATDNERILGLGDQGAGGMGIPIGKLALYTAGAGVHPELTLPVCLDCGTDNEDLLADPHYLGYAKPRLRGAAYDAFIEAFVVAIMRAYPNAILQWEDFKQHNAIRLLQRYRDRLPSFNDDIQGTAAVVLGGILAALRHRGERLADQRLVFLGAGAAGLGIAGLVEAAMLEEAGAGIDARERILLLDSHGLIFEGRDAVDEDKRRYALPAAALLRLGLADVIRPDLCIDLEAVIGRVAPTVLIGTTGTAGAFSLKALRLMAAGTPAPIVLPLSNPTAKSEARPADILAATSGTALVATGSPFDPVPVGDRVRVIGQANNVFIFPGLGLGAIVARAPEITDEMFLVAARTLAEQTSPNRLEQGALYPRLADLRPISRAIAVAVANRAHASGLAGADPDQDVPAAVDAAMWWPNYSAAVDGGVAAGEAVDVGAIEAG